MQISISNNGDSGYKQHIREFEDKRGVFSRRAFSIGECRILSDVYILYIVIQDSSIFYSPSESHKYGFEYFKSLIKRGNILIILFKNISNIILILIFR